MLAALQEFRRRLDRIMLQCMHESVLLYGYESYTGRFIKWYAEYYHGIDVNYLVSTDMSRCRAYDQEVFRPSILDFDYKDVRNAVIWVAEPVTPSLEKDLTSRGYKKDATWFDFYGAIYGEDVSSEADPEADVYSQKKSGRRDIQFLEWLEWKYDCNFVQRIKGEEMIGRLEGNSGYACTTQKEIFPILDHCHVTSVCGGALFDFGCGKGGALVSALDYGFQHVGGIEYDSRIYEIAKMNMERLHLEDRVELLHGDAGMLTCELDAYNWFFYWFEGLEDVGRKIVDNLKDSIRRNPRVIHILFHVGRSHAFIEDGGFFHLVNEFTVDSRHRVVGVFENFLE